ncbi:MAG: hypothetical protein WAO24_09670 [Peptococcia bacterium]
MSNNNGKGFSANKSNKESIKELNKKYSEEFASEFSDDSEELAKPEMFVVKKEKIGKRTVEDYPSKPK